MPIATNKSLPAFGRELMQMREAGLVPARGICVISLDRWDCGKGHARVVVTPDLEPEALNFAFVAGIEAAIIHDPVRTPIERLNACIRSVLRCNPSVLLVVTLGDVIRLACIKSRRVGIELAEFR